MPSTDDCMIIDDSDSDTGLFPSQLSNPASPEPLKAPPPTPTIPHVPVHHQQQCQEVQYPASVNDHHNSDDKLVNR